MQQYLNHHAFLQVTASGHLDEVQELTKLSSDAAVDGKPVHASAASISYCRHKVQLWLFMRCNADILGLRHRRSGRPNNQNISSTIYWS